jgi:hypothetical protein
MILLMDQKFITFPEHIFVLFYTTVSCLTWSYQVETANKSNNDSSRSVSSFCFTQLRSLFRIRYNLFRIRSLIRIRDLLLFQHCGVFLLIIYTRTFHAYKKVNLSPNLQKKITLVSFHFVSAFQ